MSDNESTNEVNNQIKLPDFIQRMNTELTELRGRIEKLTKFMNESEVFKKMDHVRQGLMSAQLASMVSYANILTLRINGEINIYLKDNKKDK